MFCYYTLLHDRLFLKNVPVLMQGSSLQKENPQPEVMTAAESNWRRIRGHGETGDIKGAFLVLRRPCEAKPEGTGAGLLSQKTYKIIAWITCLRLLWSWGDKAVPCSLSWAQTHVFPGYWILCDARDWIWQSPGWHQNPVITMENPPTIEKPTPRRWWLPGPAALEPSVHQRSVHIREYLLSAFSGQSPLQAVVHSSLYTFVEGPCRFCPPRHVVFCLPPKSHWGTCHTTHWVWIHHHTRSNICILYRFAICVCITFFSPSTVLWWRLWPCLAYCEWICR